MANRASLDTSDLESFVRRAQDGDSAAIAGLIESYQNDVFKFLLFMCGRPEVAEDLTQESFLKAINNLTQLDRPERFRSWLFGIAKNTFIDFTRKKSEDSQEFVDDEVLDRSSDKDSVETREAYILVQKILSQLSPDDRLILILIEQLDHSYAEVAATLEISEDAVRSRLHRAKQNFKKFL